MRESAGREICAQPGVFLDSDLDLLPLLGTLV